MLSLNAAIPKVQRTSWSITSNFEVVLTPNPQSYVFKNLNWTVNKVTEVLKTCIKNIDIPQHTADLIEKIMAGEWHISRNEDELYVVSMTFRDFNGGALYRLFKNIWNLGKYSYMDDVRFSLEVYLRDSISGESGGKYLLFGTQATWITSISQLQLSYENNEIMEFTIEFKTNEPYCDISNSPAMSDGEFKTNPLENSTISQLNNLISTSTDIANKLVNTGLSKVTEWASSWDFGSSK